MKQLNWYQIFGNTHKIPDGRTVEPTDDIQIWLNCANIWDKTYTTLSELLADTDTLLAVISSNNAIDYLVRSTTWAVGEALVPIMTDNTHPSGVASASNEARPAYYAFDETESTLWNTTTSTSSNAWIKYKFDTPTICTEAYLHVASGGLATAYKIQGSNDNSTWTDLYSGTFVVSSAGISNKVSFSNNTAYEYYRVFFPTGNISGPYSGLTALQFYTPAISNSATAMTYIGQNNYASNTLLADATWRNAICNSEYFESVLNVKVPVMTSATTPEGLVFAKSAYGSLQPYQAFDGNDNTGVHTVNYSTIEDWWIGYMFTSAVKIYVATYLLGQAQSQAITPSIKLQASDDGVTYSDVSSAEAISIPSGGAKVSGIIYGTSISEGQYCRLFTNGKGVTVHTLQFYGRKDV